VITVTAILLHLHYTQTHTRTHARTHIGGPKRAQSL